MPFIKTKINNLLKNMKKFCLNLISKKQKIDYNITYSKYYSCYVLEYENITKISSNYLVQWQKDIIKKDYGIDCKRDIKILKKSEKYDDFTVFIDDVDIHDSNFPIILRFWISDNNKISSGKLFRLKFNKKNGNFVFIFREFNSYPCSQMTNEQKTYITEQYNVKCQKVVKINSWFGIVKEAYIDGVKIDPQDIYKIRHMPK